jgi:hypothetical protein
MAACDKHQFDQAVDACGICGLGYCDSCLVRPFGTRRPAMCLACALEASGVRRKSKSRGGMFARR